MPSILPATGTTFTILTNATGTFAGLAEGAVVTADGRRYRISYAGGDGNDVVLTVVNDAPTISRDRRRSRCRRTRRSNLSRSRWAMSTATPPRSTVTATSSNQAVVPDANLTIGGSGATRTIAAMPLIARARRNDDHGDGQRWRGQRVDDVHADGDRRARTTWRKARPAAFFDTDILLANPNAAAAPVTITFLKDGRHVDRADAHAGCRRRGRRFAPTRSPASKRRRSRRSSPRRMHFRSSSSARCGGMRRAMARTPRRRRPAPRRRGISRKARRASSRRISCSRIRTPPANTAHVTYLREDAPAIVRDYPLAPGSRTTIDAGDRCRTCAISRSARASRSICRAWRSARCTSAPIRSGSAATHPRARRRRRRAGSSRKARPAAYFTTFVLLANPNDEPGGCDVDVSAGRRACR